jgi:large subunit ribosomal protein L29
MNASEYRNKSIDELKAELIALLQEKFNLNMQKGNTQTAPKPNAFRKVRKAVARIKTILNEKGSKI